MATIVAPDCWRRGISRSLRPIVVEPAGISTVSSSASRSNSGIALRSAARKSRQFHQRLVEGDLRAAVDANEHGPEKQRGDDDDQQQAATCFPPNRESSCSAGW